MSTLRQFLLVGSFSIITGIMMTEEPMMTRHTMSCRPRCGSTENMMFAGGWRLLDASEMSKAPPCCSGARDEVCNLWRQNVTLRQQMKYRGFRRFPNATYRGQPDGSFAEVGGHSCNCRTPHHRYRWEAPSHCEIDMWDANTFCEILGEKTLVLMGDSTMDQTAGTLMNMIAIGGGGCQEQVFFAQGDTLIQQPLGARNRGSHFLTVLEELNPDFIVLSTGPHIRSNRDYYHVFESILNMSQPENLPSAIATRYTPYVANRPLHIMWKTQQPGGCLPTIVERDPLNTKCIDHFDHHYNYAKFYHRDEWTLHQINRFAASKINHTHFPITAIDMRMLYWRKDAHVSSHVKPNYKGKIDCLHYCLRGTEVLSSTFPRMLLHELKTRTKYQQVEK